MLTITNNNNGWPFIKDAQDIVISLDGNDNTSITSISVLKGSSTLFSFPNFTLDASGKFVFRTREILEGLNMPWIDVTSAAPSISDPFLSLKVVYKELYNNSMQTKNKSTSLPWIPGGTDKPAGTTAWDHEKKFWTLKDRPIKSRISGADWPIFYFQNSSFRSQFVVTIYFKDGTDYQYDPDVMEPQDFETYPTIRSEKRLSWRQVGIKAEEYGMGMAMMVDHYTVERYIEDIDNPGEDERADTITVYPDDSDGTDFIYFNSLGVPERITSMGKSAESVEHIQTLFRNRYSEKAADNTSVRKTQSFSGYLNTAAERNCWMEFIESKEHYILLESGELKRIIIDEVSCGTEKFALSSITFTWHYAEGRKGAGLHG